MLANVGLTDRAIRFGVGLLLVLAPVSELIGLSLSFPVVVGAVIIGIVLLSTAFFRFCPLYRMLGTSTCER